MLGLPFGGNESGTYDNLVPEHGKVRLYAAGAHQWIP